MYTYKCIVCKAATSWFEPRSGYFACDAHKNIPPVNIYKEAEKWQTSNVRNVKIPGPAA